MPTAGPAGHHGHRGRKNDPLYSARRTLHTGADLLTDKQKDRLHVLFADEEHVEVEATWGIYQRMIGAYREQDRRRGRELMVKLIDSVSHGVPKALSELVTLGRTLKKRAADVLAYFDRPGTSNGPTEAGAAAHRAICGRGAQRSTSSSSSPARDQALKERRGVSKRLVPPEPRRDSIQHLAEPLLPPTDV